MLVQFHYGFGWWYIELVPGFYKTINITRGAPPLYRFICDCTWFIYFVYSWRRKINDLYWFMGLKCIYIGLNYNKARYGFWRKMNGIMIYHGIYNQLSIIEKMKTLKYKTNIIELPSWKDLAAFVLGVTIRYNWITTFDTLDTWIGHTLETNHWFSNQMQICQS